MKVKKQWDDGVIEVEQVWLDRATDLVWAYGSTSTMPARILAAEVGDGANTETANVYVVIAQREIGEQRKGYRRAAHDLRQAADLAHAEGPNRSLTEWAVYVAGASFLEGQAGSWL
jgi:hypothetical protein